jgi:hypothetical protein
MEARRIVHYDTAGELNTGAMSMGKLFHSLQDCSDKTTKFKQDVYVQGKYVGTVGSSGPSKKPLTNSGVCAIVTAQWLEQRLNGISNGFSRADHVKASEDEDAKTKVDLAQMMQLFFRDECNAVANKGLRQWGEPRINLLKEHHLEVQGSGYLVPAPFLKKIKILVENLADEEGVFLSNTMCPVGANPHVKPSHATGLCKKNNRFEYFDANYGAHQITAGREMVFFEKYVEIYKESFEMEFNLSHDFIVWKEGAIAE